MNNAKTLEELFINEFFTLKAKNESLESNIELLEAIEKNQDKSIEFWKNKYYELVERLKEDFEPEMSKAGSDEPYFRFRENFIRENNEEKDKYYIDIFNLKKEGEE